MVISWLYCPRGNRLVGEWQVLKEELLRNRRCEATEHLRCERCGTHTVTEDASLESTVFGAKFLIVIVVVKLEMYDLA